ncbi:DMT family transporter [Thauera sinica]|uniref:DMT family transporter n=1 Tax=Thauera sinica TaxID=2665146 RepID=A0ABW1AMK5_9RHOO|nr:DMT family transporter [Thauera sp. K11]ATE60657.1 EamA family transporter [Thauera sp. K11]
MRPAGSAHPAPPFSLPDVLMILVALVWGTSYGVSKLALAYYPVLGFLAVRFILTCVLLLPALWMARPDERRNAIGAGLPLGLLLLAIMLCETFGVANTKAANAAFLISLCIVLTPFAEWWLLQRRPGGTALVCASVSLLGAALLGGGPDARLGFGDALMLAAAVLRAVIVCLTSRMMWKRPAPALALTAVQTGVVGFGCLALAMPGGLPPLPSASSFWIATGYLVLGCTVFAFFANNYALNHSTPTRVALLSGTEPLFGAVFAMLWLGEHFGAPAWAGGALIVAASTWAVLRRGPRR